MEFPRLGSFDPRTIKGFDPSVLQKLNVQDIKAFVSERKIELLAVAIFLAGLVAAGYVFNMNTTGVADLEDQARVMREKADPIKKYKKSVEDQTAFLESLPPALGEDNFISVLTDIAQQRGVKITDFTPPTVKADKYYTKLTSRFSCFAPGFREAILFINDLEKATYAMKIENWAIRVQHSGATTAVPVGKENPAASEAFMMDLVVSSINVSP